MIKTICQVLVIVIYSMSLGIYLAMDGKPRKPYDAKVGIVSFIIIMALLYGAGTFD